MKRARSRLHRQQTKAQAPPTHKSILRKMDVEPTTQIKTRQPKIKKRVKKNNKLTNRILKLIKLYLTHLLTLIIGLCFTFITYNIFKHISPVSIKHFILPNSYLPLLLPLFLSCFFCLSFVLLNTRRGFLTSLIILILTFLKLQAVIFTPLIILCTILPFLTLEIILSLISARS
jgi:hypothetical protein